MSNSEAPRDETSVEVPVEVPVEVQKSGTASGRPSRWRAVWFAARMVEIRLRFVLVLVAAGLVVGYWETLENYWQHWMRPAATAGMQKEGWEFFCPMCPGVVRDGLEPNGSVPKCPICGMPLSQRKKGSPTPLPPGVVGRVELTPQRVRMAGVRTVQLAVQPLVHEIRTVGNVTYDETRRARIVTRVGGYVEKLLVNTTYSHVKLGDPLAEIYSPELYSAAQELIIAKKSTSQELVLIAREKLKLLGLDEREIESIARYGDSGYRLVIRAPHEGFVVRKEILEGDRIDAGRTLFELADLSTVWIEADVFERDIAALRVGDEIEATVEAFPHENFRGKVALVYPEMEVRTRTNRVRFEVDNGRLLLRPGMYATVRLKTPVQEMEPFRTILASHSEQHADDTARVSRQKVCPVTRAALGSMGPPVSVRAANETVYLCCDACRMAFESQPDRYLARIRTVSSDGVLVVPDRAVIDTGERKIVYVERSEGLFDGVEVTLGPRSGSYYPVIEGLLPGDRVAAAGAFLVDAETRLNPAASAAYFGAQGGPGGHSGHAHAVPANGTAEGGAK